MKSFTQIRLEIYGMQLASYEFYVFLLCLSVIMNCFEFVLILTAESSLKNILIYFNLCVVFKYQDNVLIYISYFEMPESMYYSY